MSVEEKVGQIMVPAFSARFYNVKDLQFRRLLRLVKEYHIGGVMFYRGPAYEVARAVADHLPELAPRLPPRRKPWMSQDERMSIFEAVAFGLTFYHSITPRPVLYY